MSTIDIGAAELPQSRTHSPRTYTPLSHSSGALAADAGDFYIGSTKIDATPPHNVVQATRLTPAA